MCVCVSVCVCVEERKKQRDVAVHRCCSTEGECWEDSTEQEVENAQELYVWKTNWRGVGEMTLG